MCSFISRKEGDKSVNTLNIELTVCTSSKGACKRIIWNSGFEVSRAAVQEGFPEERQPMGEN